MQLSNFDPGFERGPHFSSFLDFERPEGTPIFGGKTAPGSIFGPFFDPKPSDDPRAGDTYTEVDPSGDDITIHILGQTFTIDPSGDNYGIYHDKEGDNPVDYGPPVFDPSGDDIYLEVDPSGDDYTETVTETVDPSGDDITIHIWGQTFTIDPSGDNYTQTTQRRVDPSGDNYGIRLDPSGDDIPVEFF